MAVKAVQGDNAVFLSKDIGNAGREHLLDDGVLPLGDNLQPLWMLPLHLFIWRVGFPG
jgi:hypothetical protein